MRLQLHFAAREHCTAALHDRVVAECRAAKTRMPAARVIGMTQIPDDQFPLANPLCRPYEAVLELQTPASDDAAALIAAVRTVPAEFDSLIQPDLSGVLVGVPHEIIPTPPTALRYLYLMRRKHTHSRAQYFDHYFNNHSKFGHRTPGIAGYTQFHVDDVVSRAAAAELGVGMWGADSVSELHLNSVEEFFAALVGVPELGVDAVEDEERFVDRANSKSFTTKVAFCE